MRNSSRSRNGDLQTEDIRFAPAYALAHVARYLNIPDRTVRNWFRGANRGRPVLALAQRGQPYASFMGLTEAHILSAIRTKHGVSLQRIRRAIDYLKRDFKSEHPLIDFRFKTNGIDLFVEEFGDIINVSRYGQVGMRDVLEIYLDRIERDDLGLPVRLFPFTQSDIKRDERIITIDPSIAFGRPMIQRSGITTRAIAERFKAGETISSLAEDFDRVVEEIEAAVRSELELDAAA